MNARVLNIPSDVLPDVRHLTEMYPQLAVLGSILRLRIVVDANSILGDLFWIHRKRVKPHARPTLQEVIQSGVVVAYAPPALHHEVIAHFEEFEERYGISRAELSASWQEYRKLFKWVAPRTNTRSDVDTTRDPTDAPYAALALQIGAAGVYTRDRDYESFELPTLDAQIVMDLRTYARHTVSTFTIKIAGLGTVVFTGRMLTALIAGLGTAWRQLRRLPPAVQLLLAFAVLGAALHEPTRKWLGKTLRDIGSVAFIAIADLVEQASATVENGRAGLAQLNMPEFANKRALALVDYVSIVCAEAEEPLNPAQIIERAAKLGYVSKAEPQEVSA